MSSRLQLMSTRVEGLNVLQRNPIGDHRGYLERLFCQQELQPLLNGKSIAQINHTLTEKKGSVRGMHYQTPPHAEIKFVSCICGKVLDVAIDLRKGSPTFMHYHSDILTPDNHKTLVIPEGFAHGFQTLTDGCEMLYFHSASYCQESESALNTRDPLLNIQWPLEITDISERDQSHPMIDSAFVGVEL